MLNSYTALVRALLVPLALLLAAHFSQPYLHAVPPTYRPLLMAMPYAAALLPAIIALLLNQSRVVCIAVLLMLCYWGLTTVRAVAASDPFQAAVLFSACGILVPLNIALFSRLRERGILNGHGVLRLGLLLAQLGLVAWLIAAHRVDILQLATREFLPFQLTGLRLPHSALVAFLLAVLLQLWQLWRDQSVLTGGLLLVLLAVAIACNRADTYMVPEAFLTAAALMLVTSLILHTHHIAYRDELTGLPSRRALNERLAALGRRYTIAMLDVDHFKQFNDTYGHDVGDQVLRMVASQIRRVGGGGRAYRYGGEEFTVVFSGKSKEQARPHLEAVRKAIAGYALVLRGKDRPESAKTGRDRRGQSQQRQAVNITISIGMAERTRDLRDPELVIKAADEALYRAKKAGRNRLAG